MRITGNSGWLVVLTMVLVGGVGCGSDLPDLGTVTGTVTLDGEPEVEKMIQLRQVGGEGGSTSRGLTDEEGKYELMYDSGVKGAHVGTNEVFVSTQFPDGEMDEGDVEDIPGAYNGKTVLKFEVKPGSNTIDLPLKSDGSPVPSN